MSFRPNLCYSKFSVNFPSVRVTILVLPFFEVVRGRWELKETCLDFLKGIEASRYFFILQPSCLSQHGWTVWSCFFFKNQQNKHFNIYWVAWNICCQRYFWCFLPRNICSRTNPNEMLKYSEHLLFWWKINTTKKQTNLKVIVHQSDSLHCSWYRKYSGAYWRVGWHCIVGFNNTLTTTNKVYIETPWLQWLKCNHQCSQVCQFLNPFWCKNSIFLLAVDSTLNSATNVCLPTKLFYVIPTN